MTFNPSSTIYLCNVPIDNTYKNQLRFKTRDEQIQYFASRVTATFANYLTVRKTNADGSMVSSVKVERNIDDLYNCNYMYYQNKNHGDRYFFAFITKLIYINEGTTEIVFECDVWQTWFKDITLLDSFVVREHSATDEIGDNVIPEPFNYSDYTYSKLPKTTKLNDGSSWGYLIASSEALGMETFAGKIMSGVYQGLYFYYFKTAAEVNGFVEQAGDETDCIVSISLIPSFSVSKNTVEDNGYMHLSNDPACELVEIDLNSFAYTFDGYTPYNKKMFTSPFVNLIVTNHSGSEKEYNIEDFSPPFGTTVPSSGSSSFINPGCDIGFVMRGDVSISPSVILYPVKYKGVSQNIDEGIYIGGFPQCSTNTDSFKLWLAKNQYTPAVDLLSIGGSMLGLALAPATGGASAAVTAGVFVGSASHVANRINDAYQATKTPNRTNNGNTKNNLLTGMDYNCFEFFIRTVKRDFAETVDQYFTMFGYKSNKVKNINIFSRPYYNYIETQNVNITGGIPDDDMVKIKKMFDSGVTFWNPNASLFNYNMDEQDNRPQ